MKGFLNELWRFANDHKVGSGVVIGFVVSLFGGAGWLIGHYIERSEAAGAIIAYIRDAPGTINVKIDNENVGLDSTGDWARVRFESVEPGEHVLIYGYDGFHTHNLLVEAKGAGDNPFELPALVRSSESKPPLSRIPLQPIRYNERSKSGDDPRVPNIYWDLTSQKFPNLTKVQTGRNDDNYWVFLGSRDESNWLDRRFILKSLNPKSGDYIIAKELALARRDAPERSVFGSSYRLGSLEAIIDSGQKVEILSVRNVGGGNYWAQVGALSPTGSEIREEDSGV